MGEIIREEVNIDGIRLGLTEDELKKCAPLSGMSNGFLLQQMLTPSWAGRRIDQGPIDMIKMVAFFAKKMSTLKDDSFVKEATGKLDVNAFLQHNVKSSCSCAYVGIFFDTLQLCLSTQCVVFHYLVLSHTDSCD